MKCYFISEEIIHFNLKIKKICADLFLKSFKKYLVHEVCGSLGHNLHALLDPNYIPSLPTQLLICFIRIIKNDDCYFGIPFKKPEITD